MDKKGALFVMIRFIALNAFIAIYTIFLSIWCLLLAFFDRTGRIIHFKCAVPWAKGILWVCGVKVMVKGLAHVNRDIPRIYMTNHQSYFDILAVLACLPVDFKFILKQELMKIPILGFCLKRVKYIPIDRENPRKAIKSMNEAAQKIKNGSSVLIFPEGTRSIDGEIQPFKPGGFHLALKSGCDIVPITIVNSRKIVPKGSLRIEKGSFTMNIHKPIPVKGYSRKDMDQLMNRIRETMINQMNEELNVHLQNKEFLDDSVQQIT